MKSIIRAGMANIYLSLSFSIEEYATIIVDFGGRVEELALSSVSVKDKARSVQQVLLSHNGDAAAIKENTWWKGMFLVPWANRIAYVSNGSYRNTMVEKLLSFHGV